jgi:hypothetical protein
MMPPSAGTAPPASPVPEPRGTIGTLACFRRLDHGRHFVDIRRHDDDFRHDLEDRTVLLVDDYIFLLDENVMFADDGAQRANQFQLVHRFVTVRERGISLANRSRE